MSMKDEAKRFRNNLGKTKDSFKSDVSKVIKLSCERVRSTSLDDMAKTQRNMNVSYFTHNKNVPHHPSLPGNAPAPDSGNLRDSIHYTIDEEDSLIIGRVGTDVDYGRMLELGTSRVAPRPWLKPSVEKNREVILNDLGKVLKRNIEK